MMGQAKCLSGGGAVKVLFLDTPFMVASALLGEIWGRPWPKGLAWWLSALGALSDLAPETHMVANNLVQF